jgi:glycosyltransferase involved in cell wall biosynthesis
MDETGNPRVSVYIPTRNRVGLLSKAVESVLDQTYRNIELIVVNDASTDDTQAYLHEKAKADPRLLFVASAVPLGAPAARNIAIMRAAGVFVTGLDDDDIFLPERIAAFVDYWHLLTLRGLRPACIYAQDIWLNNGVEAAPTRKQSSVTADELLKYNYIGNQVFAPKTHFIEAGLFDEHLPAWQDLEFFIRLLQRFGRAHLLDMPTYLFDATLRPDRISAQELKIRKAFTLVAAKHAAGNATVHKSLFLQMFQDGYCIAPGAADWLQFLRWGGFPSGLLRMLRATLAPPRKEDAASQWAISSR